MTCVVCGQRVPGRALACPVVCRSRQRERLRAGRGAVTDYRLERKLVAIDAMKRRTRWMA
jgi:hypothetical protein